MADPTGAILGLMGGGLGAGMDAISREKARQALLAALKKFGLEDLADDAARTEQLGPSAMEGIRVDPALVAAQHAALGKFQDMIDSGGLTLEDQAALNQLLGRSARNEAASRAAIAEQMQRRGTAGSGTELAMNLHNQQAAAERAQDAGMSRAAMAQRRVYDAIMGRGQLAGNMRTQEYSEKERAAQARDRIAQYNAQARERARQQKYGNRMQLANAQAGGLRQQADFDLREGKAMRQDAANMGAYASEAFRPESGGGYDSYGYGDPYDPNYSGPSRLGEDEEDWK